MSDQESHPNLVLMGSRSVASAARCETARNLETAIRERIARMRQNEVARASGIEKTAINRIVNGERGVTLAELHDFFAALGMAVIDCAPDDEIVSLPQSELDALRTLARKGLA